MSLHSRVKLARRHAGLSQAQLAQRLNVHRSAVTHWELSGKRNPNMTNLRQLAEVTGVQFEWLATGRGGMALLMDARDAVAAADALLIEDDLEMRLIRAFRDMPVKSKVPVAEIVEQLAVGRMGVKRR
jgi:transcriptional regulator with XRE-family HTH domain